MKIAVTGGFGFIGRNIVKRLLDDGHEINILSHNNKSKGLFKKDVTIYNGSIKAVDSLLPCFKGCDVVIHLVGIIAETRTKTFENLVVAGTANVVTTAQNCKVQKIIYMSAMGTKPDAESKYHQSKYKAEREVISSDIPYTILRPSLVFGEGDGFVSMLTQMMKFSPFLPIIGNGKYQMQPVYIDDLVEAVSQTVEKAETNGKIIELGGPEKLEYLEILHILKKVTGKKRMNFYFPKLLMKSIAAVLEAVVKPAPITRDQIIMMDAGNTGDIEDMKKIFNIEPLSFQDGLEKYMR